MICEGDENKLFDLNNNRTAAFIATLIEISSAYTHVHKYISLAISAFGIIANTVHVMVLTRSEMRRSAVNRLLAIMAMCDITTMFSYLVFNIRFGFLVDVEQPPFGFALPWICFLLVHVVCSIALRTVSIYLSVVTAYIRYHAINKLASKWMMAASARPIFLVILLLVALTSIPTFLIHGIVEVDPTLSQNESLYTIIIPELALANECLLFKSNLWLTGILFKVKYAHNTTLQRTFI
ncbi:unnamed protein product [Toxocara canis]|uniref:G_PROTEIN_RECEP_F1_2 domain-containing protein n=1 Tax=Toxocara canis TaxID=6265 RepID=A0A183UD12_TOXCA|nr:unnamed protein product [Toxocara canis]